METILGTIGKQTWNTQTNKIIPLEDDGLEWQSLPYEIAHGIAKVLAAHIHELNGTKKEHAKELQNDPAHAKAKTQKLRTKVEKMQNADTFLVFNRRTGDLATSEWTKKYLIASADGKPQLRNDKGKLKISVITLRIVIVDGAVNLSLRSSDDRPFQKVRCWSLEQGRSNSKLAQLMTGYQHLLRDDPESDGEDTATKMNKMR